MKLKFLIVTTNEAGESCGIYDDTCIVVFDTQTDKELNLQPSTTYLIPADLIALPEGFRLLTDKERAEFPQILETAFYLDSGRMWRKKGPYTEHCWVSTETYAIPTDTVFPNHKAIKALEKAVNELKKELDAINGEWDSVVE